MAGDDWLVVQVKRVLFLSAGALRVDFGPIEDWIPKKLIRDYHIYAEDYGIGYSGPVAVPRWKVEQNKWESFVIGSREQRVRWEEEALSHAKAPDRVITLKKATVEIYKGHVRKYHPDLNPNAGEVLRDINELWQAIRLDLQEQGVSLQYGNQ